MAVSRGKSRWGLSPVKYASTTALRPSARVRAQRRVVFSTSSGRSAWSARRRLTISSSGRANPVPGYGAASRGGQSPSYNFPRRGPLYKPNPKLL